MDNLDTISTIEALNLQVEDEEECFNNGINCTLRLSAVNELKPFQFSFETGKIVL